MARVKESLPVETNPLALANPEIFGADLATVVWGSVGFATTAVGNDRLVAPALKSIVPALYQNEVVGKLVDSGTTLLVAALLGDLVRRINRPIGNHVHLGGAIYAGGKLISIVLPGFSLGQPTLPFHVPQVGVQPAAPPPQQPAGQLPPAQQQPTSSLI
jgi:hypothetical protein